MSFAVENDFKNRVASASRSSYPTLIPPSALSPSEGYRSNYALFFSLIFFLFRSFHDVELPSCPLANPAGKLGIVRALLSIQFSPSWRSRCQESRPTNRTFCLFSPLAKERWWKSLMKRRMERKKERDRERKKCALLARTDFLELLMTRDSEKTRFCPPEWFFISLCYINV